jgi:hypothetical protein
MSSSPATEAEKESPELTESSPEEAVVPHDGEDGYITGVKLWLVLGSVTLTCFLALLDTTIVATVIFLHISSPCRELRLMLDGPLGHSKNHEPLPFPRRRRMVSYSPAPKEHCI